MKKFKFEFVLALSHCMHYQQNGEKIEKRRVSALFRMCDRGMSCVCLSILPCSVWMRVMMIVR